ncbi:hypothetical protein BRC71_06395 [Halobacteriales archaeon QH_7_65_31]|nr:MAG: hypothetical protein BRC71_06395 [Halobacteriales archaeon QH_7_65_31]
MSDDITVADVISPEALEGDECDDLILNIASSYVNAVNQGIDPGAAAGATMAVADAIRTHAGVPDEQAIESLARMNDMEIRYANPDDDVLPDGGYGEERLYSDEHRNEIMKQQAGAMERAADALELLAGMQMMRFEYNEDMPSYSVEGLVEEARFYARGGRDE